MTEFIASVFTYRNRVSSQEAFEGLEPDEGKLSRPVLRGPGSREAAWLLGTTGNWRDEDFHLARFTVLSAAHPLHNAPFVLGPVRSSPVGIALQHGKASLLSKLSPRPLSVRESSHPPV